MKKILLLSTLIFALSSCEEVIELELDTTEQRIVVESNLDATHGICKVSLSKTGDFYASNSFEKIPGASILLNTPSGGETSLIEMSPGVYSAENLQVSAGDAVSLSIVLPGGERIDVSNVIAPAPVSLDSLLIVKSMGGAGPGGQAGGSTDQYSLTAEWKDALGSSDFYRLKIYQNSVFQSGTYILTDDRLGDGEPISRPVIRQTFDLGDTLHCQLLAVNKGYYDYFTDLANGDGRGYSSPAPFNPKGNFSGGVLGYFGVWYVSEKTIIVN